MLGAMDSKKSVGKTAKSKPKRSPKKAAVRDSREVVRESQSETYNPWAYFAKYFDQI